MFTRKTQKAFTLIELLVVVAIIAILTAIVMTNLTAAKGKSRDAKRISDLAQMQLALELFFDKCNSYPTGPLTGATSAISFSSCPTINLGMFLSQIPISPTPGSYAYGVSTDANGDNIDYVLMAPLESNNTALSDDIDDANLYGIDCRDLNYCVGPK